MWSRKLPWQATLKNQKVPHYLLSNLVLLKGYVKIIAIEQDYECQLYIFLVFQILVFETPFNSTTRVCQCWGVLFSLFMKNLVIS